MNRSMVWWSAAASRLSACARAGMDSASIGGKTDGMNRPFDLASMIL